MFPQKNGLYVGFETGTNRLLSYRGDRHALIVGGNGTGKSKRLVLPNILRSVGRSLVVLDPKGDYARLTAKDRAKVSKVVIIDPYNVAGVGSAGFNPLLALDPAAVSFPADAALLAEAQITREAKDPHWSEQARILVAWLIMYVVERARATGRVPNLGVIRRLLCMESGGDDIAGDAYGLPRHAKKACASGIEALRNKAGLFTRWNREISSIVSTAMRQTDCFDDCEIAEELQGNFDFGNLRRELHTVYLIIPPNQLERQGRYLRLLLSSAIMACLQPDVKAAHVARVEAEEKGGKATALTPFSTALTPFSTALTPFSTALTPFSQNVASGEFPVTMFIDEFAALGHLEIIETVWALVRGYGLQIVPVLQDLSQIKAIYSDRWESFIGNTGAAAFFTPGDSLTANWLSRRLGEKVVQVPSFGVGQNGDIGMSLAQQRQPYQSAFDLYGMKPGEMWVFLAHLSAGIKTVAPWWQDVQWYKPAA